jgi:hypothetical protein
MYEDITAWSLISSLWKKIRKWYSDLDEGEKEKYAKRGLIVVLIILLSLPLQCIIGKATEKN